MHRGIRQSTRVVLLCFGVLAGLGLSRKTSWSLEALTLSPVLLWLGWRRQGSLAIVLLVSAGMLIGGWRGSMVMNSLQAYEPLYSHSVILVGTAVDDAGYGKQSQLAFDLQNARINGKGSALPGKIGVSGFGENVIYRGDVVQVEGKLRQGLGARQGYMSFAELTVLHSHFSLLDTIRHKFAAGMESALPEPAASFAMGLLIGQKATLPDSVYQDLVMVGLVHIIAVSGYNLTIILQASLKLLGKRSKYQTMVFAVSLIAIFLLLTGASASIVRASIVSGLSMLGWYYGRPFKPMVLILLGAVLTAMANPLYLWGDIGWYLSFLAFYGVLIVAPQVKQRLHEGWWRESTIVGIGLESLCAEAMTLPLVLYIFGQMSLVSLPANIIIAVFVPMAMLLSLIAGLTGTLLTPVCGWFAWPAKQLLTYMLDAAHLLASIPHIFRQNTYLSLSGMLLMYGVVVGFNLLLYSRVKAKRAIIKTTKSGLSQPVAAPTLSDTMHLAEA